MTFGLFGSTFYFVELLRHFDNVFFHLLEYLLLNIFSWSMVDAHFLEIAIVNASLLINRKNASAMFSQTKDMMPDFDISLESCGLLE